MHRVSSVSEFTLFKFSDICVDIMEMVDTFKPSIPISYLLPVYAIARWQFNTILLTTLCRNKVSCVEASTGGVLLVTQKFPVWEFLGFQIFRLSLTKI